MKSPGALFTRHIVGAADVLAGRRSTATGVVARGDTLIVRFTRRGAGVPGTDGAAVLLRRAADAARRRRRDRRLPDRRPVPRHRVPARRARRDPPEPVLRRLQAAPRRRLRRRPARAVAGRADQADRARRGRLDHQPDAGVPEPGARAGGEVRHQSLAVLLAARADAADVRVQLVEAALPQQPGVAQGGELRARPAGAAGDRRRAPGGPAHRPVHPPARPRLSRRRRLSTRARRSGAGTRAGARQPPGWQGGLLHERLRASPRRRAAREAAAGGRSGSRSRSGPCRCTARSAAYLDRLTKPGAEWDIALVVWTPNVPDAQAYLNLLLDSHHIGGTNVAGFTSAAYDRALRRAARSAAGSRAAARLRLPGRPGCPRRRAARRAQRPQRADLRLRTRRSALHRASARRSCSPPCA